MSGGQTKNAALTTALAFHYQVLIGLDKCFSLEEGQSIWFEQDGDVSFLAQNAELSEQTEVKNYAAPLTDHHENLWKTLKNWLAKEFNHEQYGCLILHTTQPFSSKTRLKDWHSQNVEQRLQTLKDIFSERTPEELSADKKPKVLILQQDVMSINESLLKSILAKVTLITEAADTDALKRRVLSKLIGIPISNQKNYLQSLVGFIYSQADNNRWYIKHEHFRAKCEELTAQYCKKEFTFPPFTGDDASDDEIALNKNKLFVQKINEIEYYEVIPDAIGSWLELQNSLCAQLDEHPIYAEKTRAYQKRLVKSFGLEYSTATLEGGDPQKISKIFYNKRMSEKPLELDNYTPPMEYKNGLIHDAMDDENKDLKWKIKQ